MLQNETKIFKDNISTIKYKTRAIVVIIKEYVIQECQNTYKREVQMVIRKLLQDYDWAMRRTATNIG